MEQHFDGVGELHDVKILRFSGLERPNMAKRGEEIHLSLEEGSEKIARLKFLVVWREDYPNGYELDCRVIGAQQRASITVDFAHPEEDGVRLRREIALTSSLKMFQTGRGRLNGTGS